jgi:hypothetical protein
MRNSLSVLAAVCTCFVLLSASTVFAASKQVQVKATPPKAFPGTSAASIPVKSADDASHLGPIQDKWAIVIGINTFSDKRIPTLRYAAKDAEDFAKFLVDKQNFARDHVLLLTNDNATEDTILDAIGDNWLPRRAFPNDLVLVYVSSHGSPKEVDVAGENFLVAHDTKVDRLFSSGIRLEDLAPTIRKRTGCQRIVLILDACNSGAADVAAKGLVRNLNFDINSFAGEGLIVISSSQADQRSWESSRYANGVFTKRLMEALDSGSNTTLNKAFEILENAVQEEVRFDRKAFQKPLMKSKWKGSELSLSVRPASPRQVSKALQEEESVVPAAVPTATPTALTQETAAPLLSSISSISSSAPASLGALSASPSTPPAAPVATTGSRPWLGLRLDQMTPQIASTMGLPAATTGSIIRDIAPGSGASNSGLRVNDIVMSVNNVAVNTAIDVQAQARLHRVGDALSIGVLRDGKAISFGVVLGEFPPEGPAQLAATGSAPPFNPNSPFETPTYQVPGVAPAANALQGGVQRDVQALPDKIAVVPFSPPDRFDLTKTNDYPRNFTDADRNRVALFPMMMWSQVIKDLSSQVPGAKVMSAESIAALAPSIQAAKFDSANPLVACRQVGSILGARYVVITKISRLSFAARVNWSNEYNLKLSMMILDCQTGKIIANVPRTITRTPWLGDGRTWFTDYWEKMILPDFCKKLSQDIAHRLPR